MSAAGNEEIVRGYIEAENKRAVRRYVEQVWNQRAAEPFVRPLAFDVPMPWRGDPLAATGCEPASFDRQRRQKSSAELHLTIEEQIAEGDKVVTRLFATRAAGCEVPGIPGTDEPPNASVVLIHRFEGGRIAEERVLWDMSSLRSDAGAMELHDPVLATV